MNRGAYFLLGIFATVAAGAAVGLAILYSGSYRVAAISGHGAMEKWLFETAMENSVRAGASGLEVPEPTPEGLREGRAEFGQYCVHCHGAPGAEPHEWTRGMVPNPPGLSHAAADWSTAELFWIVKHGIKMTGMPAFGDDRDDATLWNIAHFVERLPETSAADYRAMGGDQDAGAAHSGHSH